MYSGVVCSPNLVLPSCIEDFTHPLNPMSNLTVLPICSQGLLNLLTTCLILSRLHLWVLLLLLLLIWLLFAFSWQVEHVPSGNIFQASAGSSSCLARPARSTGLSLPCYQSLEWCRWTSEIGGATCLWCPYAGDLFIQNAINVRGHRSGLFLGVGVDPFEVW